MACLVWWFTDEKCWFPLWWKIPIDKNQFWMRRNSLAIVGSPPPGETMKKPTHRFWNWKGSKPFVWVKQCHKPPHLGMVHTTFTIGDLRDGLLLFYPWKKHRVSLPKHHPRPELFYQSNRIGVLLGWIPKYPEWKVETQWMRSSNSLPIAHRTCDMWKKNHSSEQLPAFLDSHISL